MEIQSNINKENIDSFLEKLTEDELNSYMTSFIRPSDEVRNVKNEHLEYFFASREKEIKQLESNLKYANKVSLKRSLMYSECRSIVISFMCDLAKCYKVFRTTLETSIYIYDTYLERKEVSKGNLQLVAITSFYLAAKTDETHNIPTIVDLCSSTKDTYTCEDVIAMEKDILVTNEWNVSPITCSHFLDYFMMAALEKSDFTVNIHLGSNITSCVRQFTITVSKTCDILQFCPQYKHINPSILACSAIAATRRILNIFPVWTPGLACLSGYDLTDFKLIYTNIVSDFKQTLPDSNQHELDIEIFNEKEPYPVHFLRQLLKRSTTIHQPNPLRWLN